MGPEPLRPVDFLDYLLVVGGAWVVAAANGFSKGWTVVAVVMTGACLIGFIRRVTRR